jgi:hypothetical protein
VKIVRRYGTSPQQRGSLSGDSCPDVLELDTGDFLIIGRVATVTDITAADLAAHEASIGEDEAAVIVPRDVVHAAAAEIRQPAPNPPGSTREQLPDHLINIARPHLPDYLSTACQTADVVARQATYRHPLHDELRAHAERLHDRCRLNHKFTGQLCACGCHDHEQPDPA